MRTSRYSDSQILAILKQTRVEYQYQISAESTA